MINLSFWYDIRWYDMICFAMICDMILNINIYLKTPRFWKPLENLYFVAIPHCPPPNPRWLRSGIVFSLGKPITWAEPTRIRWGSVWGRDKIETPICDHHIWIPYMIIMIITCDDNTWCSCMTLYIMIIWCSYTLIIHVDGTWW